MEDPLFRKGGIGGEAGRGARVRVESCDIARAMDDLLRDGGGIQSAAVPILPPARREVRASSDGTFRIEGGDVLLPGSLVIEADGFERRSMPLKGIATDYGEIALAPRGRGPAGSVTLDFQRPALRDVRVFVNGKPIPKKTLQSGERLVIPGVEPGIYGIRVQETSEEDSFPVFERAAIALPLTQPLVVPLR